jgi:hypothetical protein
MATKKPTEGPKAKLMKLSVVTLRKKAKALNISDIAGRTKENLVQSIMISEARKKGAAKRKTATKQGSLFRATRVPRSGEQTGRSDAARDEMRRALAPGKRLSRTGKVYYERRRNRSDVPPTMLGDQKYNGWTNYWTWRWALEMIDEDYLYDIKNDVEGPYELAEVIKEQAEQYVDESAKGWVNDWMNAILGEINWREIAESYY